MKGTKLINIPQFFFFIKYQDLNFWKNLMQWLQELFSQKQKPKKNPNHPSIYASAHNKDADLAEDANGINIDANDH